MSISATIDPAGTNGGPVVETYSNRLAETAQLTWETMPERLLAAGVSWKVYNGLAGLSPFPYFAAYDDRRPGVPGALLGGVPLQRGRLPLLRHVRSHVPAVPTLPSTSIASNTTATEEAVLNALAGTEDVGIPYPIPSTNAMPAQETSPARPEVP